MTRIVEITCVLLIAGSVSAQTNCQGKAYSLSLPAKCAVSEEIKISFGIKETTPDQTNCKETETVCVKITRTQTTIAFNGTFPEATKLIKITGGTSTVQLPVVRVTDKSSFADPMVGVFSKATFTAAEALKFAVTIDTPTITAKDPLIQGTASTNCNADKLCFLVAGKDISLWGTRGTIDSVAVKGTGDTTVIIPLIDGANTDVNPSPRILSVPSDGKVATPVPVLLPIAVDTVAVTSGNIVQKANCKAIDACYDVILAPSTAKFTGVMPASPTTIKISGNSNQEFISYLFDNAGNIVNTGTVAFMMTLGAVYVSLIQDS